jgi:hypothetical protein
MKRDPKPRKDGRCALSGCTRARPKWRKSAHASATDYATNSFCSRECCERFHEIDKTYIGEKVA